MDVQPTLKQLRHLVALADNGHFGAAAKACFVTQSTLSASLKELETILGAPLVDRTKRRVAFTPLGDATVERARRLLEEAEALLGQLQAGRLDALLLALPYDLGGAEFAVLFQDRFSLALRRGHPLARQA